PRGRHVARAGRHFRGRGSRSEQSKPTAPSYMERPCRRRPGGRRRSLSGAMRVVIADPPAFTPAYDHELAAALARAGADVELVTSRFRFGEAPRPDGYPRGESFYPLSSRLFRRSRLRLP